MTHVLLPRVGVARRLSRPIAVAGAGVLAVSALVLHDPHVAGSWGVCPFLALTGLYCPACGGLRAVNDLAHLRLADAVDSNVLAVSMVAYGTLVWLVWTVAQLRGKRFAYRPWLSPAVMIVLLVVAVVFAVIRNLPFGSWLAP